MSCYYIVSGGFDPIHEGHIEMIKASAAKSDGVILLLNSDEWLCRKKGKNFMSFKTRLSICENIKNVVDAFGFDDTDNSACDGIRKARAKYPVRNWCLLTAATGPKTTFPKRRPPQNVMYGWNSASAGKTKPIPLRGS